MNELLVSTGDAAKYLDRFVIENGALRFKSRICKYFGGFTAAATVRGDLYFGTDFSERPNYIFRLSDKEKFFFPAKSFTRYADTFEVLADRYIIGRTASLFDTNGAYFVFDTLSQTFVYAE